MEAGGTAAGDGPSATGHTLGGTPGQGGDSGATAELEWHLQGGEKSVPLFFPEERQISSPTASRIAEKHREGGKKGGERMGGKGCHGQAGLEGETQALVRV